MQDLSTNSKLVEIYVDKYWQAKFKSGYVSSSLFDESCGIAYSNESIIYTKVKYIRFFIVDEKKFNYARIKYEF